MQELQSRRMEDYIMSSQTSTSLTKLPRGLQNRSDPSAADSSKSMRRFLVPGLGMDFSDLKARRLAGIAGRGALH